ncbi:hypothetical protein T02_12594 [Trichinella nativa]|uniref:Uncharacterized protein n=1 Tax=Trichinella nativa TaxID=6335 RepID=A0A0V1LGE7_9BILA|nr:hypothetical protein T02_12594 [Trichinella nativa]
MLLGHLHTGTGKGMKNEYCVVSNECIHILELGFLQQNCSYFLHVICICANDNVCCGKTIFDLIVENWFFV